jgi:A/G-specific adenine glycosylase
MSQYENFTQDLEKWYALHKRPLLWRETGDPYKIWVSEIMLQQTQVPRVQEVFYPRFLEKFPTIQDLAKADWEDVFPVWEGLGYYARGKNLLKTAKLIAEKYKGEIPKDMEQLKVLPGIGAYTAAAIFAFAWDEKVPAIDTNISKIITILFPNEDVPKVARRLVSCSVSGRDWNNAMMDLATALRAGQEIEGALRNFFPLELLEKFVPASREKGARTQEKKKTSNFRIEVGIACIYREGKYLIQTRPEGKSFVGRWEFPGGKREKGEDMRACVKRELKEELGVTVSVRPHFHKIEHSFEKITLVLYFHRCQIQEGEPKPLEDQLGIEWVAPADFGKYDFLDTNAGVLEKLKEMRM